MDAFHNLLLGFSVALTPINLFWCLVGVLMGTVVGVLPGLGPAATIAMLLPLTLKMDHTTAIIALAGIFYGARYGGSTTSILLNIPGESSSVVTCLDGYQMARKGRAGAALGISAIASFVAGTIGVRGLDADCAAAGSLRAALCAAGVFCLDGLGTRHGGFPGGRVDGQSASGDARRSVDRDHRHRSFLRRIEIYFRPGEAPRRRRFYRGDGRDFCHR